MSRYDAAGLPVSRSQPFAQPALKRHDRTLNSFDIWALPCRPLQFKTTETNWLTGNHLQKQHVPVSVTPLSEFKYWSLYREGSNSVTDILCILFVGFYVLKMEPGTGTLKFLLQPGFTDRHTRRFLSPRLAVFFTQALGSREGGFTL